MAVFHKKILKSSAAVASATMLSRLLGLVRVMLIARVLGGGAVASAWYMAFMIPNLFRRLLGEGALGTALVPIITRSLEAHGREETKRAVAIVFIVLSLILGSLCVLIATGCLIFQDFPDTERGRLTLQLLPLLIPYAFFMCLVGASGAVLNTLRIFFLPALGALSLNIFMIACLWLVCPALSGGSLMQLRYLAFAVLLAGATQLAYNLVILKKYDLFPSFRASCLKSRWALRELWTLVLPGLAGAGAVQISFFADRTLAYFLGDQAVPALVYSDRLVYLPIGVIAVSFGTVLLPNMSKAAEAGDNQGIVDALQLALRQMLFITIPIALFTVFMGELLLKVIYFGGNFTESDLQQTLWALRFYAVGIPFFCTIKACVSAFYARRDMITPLKISILCISVNIILNVILMFPLRQAGIALATVIASLLNNLLLLLILKKKLQVNNLFGGLLETVIKSGIATMTAIFTAHITWEAMKLLDLPWKSLILLLTTGGVFCLTYLLCALFLRSRECREVIAIFKRD
jgi:putative peptidoglycan lipid II flippase